MIIYLIGPSGIGKSTQAAKAGEYFGVQVKSIDAICKGKEFEWNFCRKTLKGIEKDKSSCIVDIGGGTQTLAGLTRFLSDKTNRVVLLIADPSELILWNPLGPGRNQAEFESTEYTSRKELYFLAGHKII
jgi:shikimate kinase